MTAAVATESNPLAIALSQQIEDSHRAMTQSKAELLSAIQTFDELALAIECGSTTTAHFLMRRLGVSSSTAHEYVSVAHRLRPFRYLHKHFTAAALSYSVVRLLLKYMTTENERELVDLALGMGFHELECALAGKKPQDGKGEDSPQCYLSLHKRDNGDIAFHGKMNAADGAAFIAALKIGEIAYCNLDEVLEDLDPEVNEEINIALERAEEVEENRPARKTVSGYGLPIGRMLLRALMGIVHMARTTPRSTLTTPGAHVNILATPDGRGYMPNNVGAPSKAIASLLANADIRLSTVNSNGLVINTGRKQRLATNGQVNALLAMWGGQCAAPGCTHTRFIEIHHIEDWASGGLTDLENLLPLCSACHSLVTEGYLQTLKEHSDIHFVYRDGTRFVSTNYSLPRRDDIRRTMEECNWSFND
ncbi:HNH endonuclease signature motif containing protein [Corynebacterium haemomassiliense]|uniref:HNH endonuclease n=1 Tax=Corynebacterium haemomassiliense TaxID=2754726 RepID=A0A7W2I453_9CORY|nr:HNH endonuclease [Corynebacterium haemomassiliense]MBA5244832.1 HNH endonuclease [Corynebacterium haemomassiliense]